MGTREEGLAAELAWWAGNAREDLEERANPNKYLDARVADLCQGVEGPVVITDIGAGPVSILGWKAPVGASYLPDVRPFDPLAEGYSELLKKLGISPPKYTKQAEGEHSEFPMSRVVHIRNALDHCAFPQEVLRNAAAHVEAGGYLLIRSGINEGTFTGGSWLHRWDIEPAGRNDFTMTSLDTGKVYSARDILGTTVDIWVEATPVTYGGGYMTVTISEGTCTK